jgi:uncharacterized Zn finger protein
MSYWGYKPYVPVAKRRADAAKQVKQLAKGGRSVSPVVIEGRRIAASFWGKAWCDNLEHYSDYANRLPRGRTYVRNGSVIDLSVAEGRVEALVSGSEIYNVRIDVAQAIPQHWRAICADCSGSIGSIVELLQGKLAKKVIERVCREGDGLFPGPREIKMSCTCPDWADMCKHVAAVLYGIGARFDADPDALFTLRGVDRNELIAIGVDPSLTEPAATNERVLDDDDMAALFDIELEAPPPAVAKGKVPKATSEKRSARKLSTSEPAQEPGDKVVAPRRTARPAEKDTDSVLTEPPTASEAASKAPRTKTTKAADRAGEKPVRLSVRKQLAQAPRSERRGRRR